MSKAAQHIIGLVRLELQDLQEDLRIMEHQGRERYKKLEITAYVMKENHALFEGEIKALVSVEKILDDPTWTEFKQPEDFFREFTIAAKNHLEHHQYPQAVFQILQRKLNKVQEFLQSS